MNPEYIKLREIIERVEIVCPVEEKDKVLDELEEQNWCITRRGAYRDEETFPGADMKRFTIQATRQIDKF